MVRIKCSIQSNSNEKIMKKRKSNKLSINKGKRDNVSEWGSVSMTSILAWASENEVLSKNDLAENEYCLFLVDYALDLKVNSFMILFFWRKTLTTNLREASLISIK